MQNVFVLSGVSKGRGYSIRDELFLKEDGYDAVLYKTLFCIVKGYSEEYGIYVYIDFHGDFKQIKIGVRMGLFFRYLNF